jgi:hypothetical protein
MSERDTSEKASRPRTRQALHNLIAGGGEDEQKSRRQAFHSHIIAQLCMKPELYLHHIIAYKKLLGYS